MKLTRHKNFKKDELKIKLTEGQYQKRIEYLSLILKGEPLPPQALRPCFNRRV